MAARKCPLCLTEVPAGLTVAFTDGFACPGCGKRLEVSFATRYLASLAGVAAAILAWRASFTGQGTLGWVLPVAYAVLSYGTISALAQMAIADLVVKEEPAPEMATESAAHSHH